MLELKNITKEYPAGNGKVEALKGVSLQFRESEFVAILGPSGCGKTTLLNIIGGLDQYTSGDLVINGRSTKDFKDRDWDSYRNHSVGFVFQSYNLIPHQSVLQNVELALSLSGVPKSERKKRAIAALEEVGLGDQLRKKPGEMSGGQMQRVAIARAIVNNPDIILADEPTGALDTETSVQVMEILKEISKNRLIIMVTHNPDLAERYATRTIRMLDGLITSDSMPISAEEITAEEARIRKEAEAAKQAGRKSRKDKKPTLSFGTSFGLSLKNLISKKGRTILTSFAGSIGIIGIALIYAVSQGTTNYIDAVQEDTLSSYPLTLEAQSLDLTSLMMNFMGAAQSQEPHENDAVYQKTMIRDMINALNSSEMKENDLKSFKEYVEQERYNTESPLYEAITGVQYTYDTNMQVYTKNVDGDIILSDSQELMQELLLKYFGMDMSTVMGMSEANGMSTSTMASMSSMSPMGSSLVLWQEMLSGDNGSLINPLLEKQYDVVYGSWPNSYNEVVLVLDQNNELDDMTLYALGLKSRADVEAIMESVIDKTELESTHEHWTYEEICDMEFRIVLPFDCYTKDEHTGLYTDLRDTNAGLKYLYDKGLPLKVSGIIRPNEDALSNMLSGSIGYTYKLTEYIMEQADSAAAIQAQMDTPDTDIFTGLPFRESLGNMTDAEKEAEFKSYIKNLNSQQKADTYVRIMSIPAQADVDAAVAQSVGAMTREQMVDTMSQAITQQTGMASEEITSYIEDMSDEDLKELFAEMAEEQYKMQYAAQVQAQLQAMTTEQLAGAFDMAKNSYTTEQCAIYYEEVLEFSEGSYDENLKELGHVDPESPSSINLYASSFENKDVIEEAIADYNDSVDELSQIKYTDYVGLMMSSITSIINAITYVLISFVAVSLVVSSIMIGVITLISVQERTKEIGILRAIGASKRNVSGMFNAETVIIGFTSGLLGVLVTYALCIPINLILHEVTGISTLSAHLPVPVAVALVIISMVLTLISGIIPSRSAAKKDPVVALRTE